jgi:hypothetical protein
VKSLVPHFRERIAALTSANGQTWNGPRSIAESQIVEPPNHLYTPIRAGQYAIDAASDPKSGRLYAVWIDAAFNHFRYDGVALGTSSDDGRHWSKAVRVASPAGKRAFTPSIAVSRQGVVGITYYTIPATAMQGSPISASCWFTASKDQGKHWTKPARIAGPFNLTAAPVVQQGYFLGDYEGLAAGSDFYPFFASVDAAGHTGVLAERIRP